MIKLIGILFLFVMLATNIPAENGSDGVVAVGSDVLGDNNSLVPENDSPLNASFIVLPESGTAPLEVKFTPSVQGQPPFTYSWDFQSDGVVDSTSESSTYTYETAGNYSVLFSVMDGSGNKVTQSKVITVLKEAINLTINSYFPQQLKSGEQEVTFNIINNGREEVRDLKGKVVGQGVQHLSSTSIETLGPREEDSLTIKLKVLRSGSLNITLKVAGHNYPLVFEVAEEKQYNKEELQAKLNELKSKVQEQEGIYYDKKSQTFLVAEVYDNIKQIKSLMQNAQQQILTDKLADAQVNLDLITSSIDDVVADLQNAKKQKQTVLMWLKDNALAITAIVAAVGTLSGLLIKLTSHVKKVGESVKQKMVIKRTITTEPKQEGNNADTTVVKEVIETENSEGNENKKEGTEPSKDLNK